MSMPTEPSTEIGCSITERPEPPQKNIRADTHSYSNVTARSAIGPSERTLWRPLRRHVYAPCQQTSADDTHIYSDRSHRAGIILWWIWSVRCEFAVQILRPYHKQSN